MGRGPNNSLAFGQRRLRPFEASPCRAGSGGPTSISCATSLENLVLSLREPPFARSWRTDTSNFLLIFREWAKDGCGYIDKTGKFVWGPTR